MTVPRTEIKCEDRWNVESLYPAITDWENAFGQIRANQQKPIWPELAAFKGKLKEGPETVKKALECLLTLHRNVGNLYQYAHLRHDEDIADDTCKQAYQKALSLYHELSQESSWFEPELLGLPEETLKHIIDSPLLKEYRFYLEKIVRIKKYTLSPEQEELIALAGQALSASQSAFSAINDADFKFGSAIDSKGESHPITHASYGLYVRGQDRTLRKNAFNQMHGKYQEYQNTLCELLNGQVQSHIFNMRARGYSTSLEAALYPKNIETGVYHALIQAVNEEMSALHDYVDFRKTVLSLDKVHGYDLHVPLTKEIEIKLPYKEAEELIIESVAPLGPHYQNLLRKGLKSERWVDRYENTNKRSGAYSSGTYDSMPFILMNYKELLRDVFTLAHEAGHSMHTLHSNQNQPYHYADYPIFLAEVASTFNEELLMRLLIDRASTKEDKFYLINQKVEDIRSTLFRQTMFAEFELFIHDQAEQQVPLTPGFLNDYYCQLNQKYFGSSFIVDPEMKVEWARIPHFYYNFYVYQYATGISAALALADRVMAGGEKERDDYLNFLKSGSSRYPLETLKLAGVDMCTTAPVKAAIGKFRSLVSELKQLGHEKI